MKPSVTACEVIAMALGLAFMALGVITAIQWSFLALRRLVQAVQRAVRKRRENTPWRPRKRPMVAFRNRK